MPRDETLERLLDGATVALRDSLSRNPERMRDCSYALRELLRDLAGRPQLRERDALLEKLQGWILEARGSGDSECSSRRSPLAGVTGLSLHAFGSSVMGISSRGGDLDISLEGEVADEGVSASGFLADANRVFKGDLLGEVHGVLRQGNRFRSSKHTQLIRQAKVPVSKFVEMNTGIHCDLSIGNSTGVFKSQLLAEVLKMDTRVRELVVVVKKWARANNMNDPTSGSFNSYCLTLLVITFGQTRKPPLLPPFKELFPGLRTTLMESGKPGSKSLLSQVEKYKNLVGEWMGNNKGFIGKNTDSLCELLMGFLVSLSLYASHSQLMHYTAEGVSKSTIRPTASPWEGGFISTGWEAKALKKYQLFVEDPFEAKDNCARTLATQDWWRICKILQETAVSLQEFINAKNGEAWCKWQDFWMTLFQRSAPLQMHDLTHWAGNKDVDGVANNKDDLMSLHRDALVEHLRRFKMSDKRFIAVSDSWWSKEFKGFVMLAVREMGLFRGDGPKKKLLISKDSDIKEALVEHAVNSTLRARKNQSTIIDPYECVVKQRLREFLKCSLRYHIFHAATFRTDIKEWVMKCVKNAGLNGEFMGCGDLRVERTLDFINPALSNSIHANGCQGLPNTGLAPQCVQLTVGNSQEILVPAGESDAEANGSTKGEGCEDTNGSAGGDVDVEGEEELHSDSDDHEGREVGESEREERTPSNCEASSCSESTALPTTSLDATLSSVNSGTAVVPADSVLCKGEDAAIAPSTREGLLEGNNKLSPDQDRGIDNVHMDSSVQLTTQCNDEKVCIVLRVVNSSQGSTMKGTISPNVVKSDSACQTTKGAAVLSSARKSEELHAPAKFRKAQEVPIASPAGSPSKMNPEQHQRNAEILRQVFFDLFQRLEDLKQSDYVVGEVQIDPTEFVVPVAWVRQQVRDIARNLFLEVVPANGKKRRAMKIRVRKRRFDESDSDSLEYNHDSFQTSPQKRQARANERVNLIHRGSDRMIRNIPLSPWPVMDDDQKDHVSQCLQWVKKQKRPFEFWTEIYPVNVQQALRERAEELGLSVEINMDKMYLGVDHSARRPASTRMYSVSSHILNEEVQAAIQRYLQQRMNQILVDGTESVQLPCKGFFMRPRWVMEEAMRIARNMGLEIIDMKDKVEVINRNKLAERQRLLQLLQQQQCHSTFSNHNHGYGPSSHMPESSGASMRQMRQHVHDSRVPEGHTSSTLDSQGVHASSPSQNILHMSHSTPFNGAPLNSRVSSAASAGKRGSKSDRPHMNGNRGSPAPESFLRQLRGEVKERTDSRLQHNPRQDAYSHWSHGRKGGRGHVRGGKRYDNSKKEPLQARVSPDGETPVPNRGRRGRGGGGGGVSGRRLRNS